jgi:FtsX-like permease family
VQYATQCRLDPDFHAFQVDSFQAYLERAYAPERANTLLVSSFGVLAVIVAAVGIYGVLRYLVQQRIGEFGIRIAIGASRRDIICTRPQAGAHPRDRRSFDWNGIKSGANPMVIDVSR